MPFSPSLLISLDFRQRRNDRPDIGPVKRGISNIRKADIAILLYVEGKGKGKKKQSRFFKTGSVSVEKATVA